MLLKKLMQVIGSVVAAGLLGMLIAYSIYGKLGGDYIQLSALFFPGREIAGEPAVLAGMEAIRARICIGGVAGILIGLGAPVLISRGKSVLETR